MKKILLWTRKMNSKKIGNTAEIDSHFLPYFLISLKKQFLEISFFKTYKDTSLANNTKILPKMIMFYYILGT